MVFLTLDNNKKISSIAYNHLNLPTVITVTGKGTITYTYDAAGNKLKKEVNEIGQALKTTLYVAGAVYENDVLQFIAHEEGRVRKSGTAYVYDYFIKDHLGNVRMVLTEEQKTDAYPAATMETGAINTESTWYGNLTNTQYAKPSWFNDPNYSTNAQVGRLKNESGSQKIGPNIILKVMAGDTYNIRVASGWNGGSATNNSTNVLNDLFNLLSSGMANVSGGKATQAELQNSSSGLNAGLTSFLGQQTTSGTKPKAYISWILLDEQFKIAKDANGNMIASGYSGFDQVKDAGSAYVHYFTNLTVNKSGYLYIYTSNEATNIDVFFDNLQVTHIRGPLIEETHYYPFGLTMSGISSKALNFGSPENKKGYNGNALQSKEFADGSGLDFYDFNARTYDQQIGRFIQIDPESESGDQESWTLYHFGYNNPILHNDPDGRFPPFKQWLQAGWDYTKGRVQGAVSTLTSGLKMQYQAAKTVVSYATNSQYRQQVNTAVVQAVNNPKQTLNNAVNRTVADVKAKINNTVTALKDPKTYTPQNVGKAVGTVEGVVTLAMGGGPGVAGAKTVASEASVISNPIPNTLARVVPNSAGEITTLGRAGSSDVFVTGASDISGLNASQVANKLTIPESPTGFKVIEFNTPSEGLASPINRTTPGFVGHGRTAGGAREFVLPNQPIPKDATIKTVN